MCTQFHHLLVTCGFKWFRRNAFFQPQHMMDRWNQQRNSQQSELEWWEIYRSHFFSLASMNLSIRNFIHFFFFFFYLEPSKCISWMMEENSILLSRNQVYGRTVSGQRVKMCPLITGAVLGRVYHVDVLDIKHSCTKSSSLLISMTAVVYRYVWLRCTSVSRASTVMVEYRLLTDILYSCILL